MRGGRAVGEAPARCRPRPAPRPLAPRAPAPEAARTAPRAPEPPRERPSHLESARGRREGLRVPRRHSHSPGRRSGPATRVVGALRRRGDPALAFGILLHRKLGTPWGGTLWPGTDTFCTEPGLGPRRPERLLRLALGAGGAHSDPLIRRTSEK